MKSDLASHFREKGQRQSANTVNELPLAQRGAIIGSMTVERAGVLIVRDDRLALIERYRDGRHFWAIPGGGVKPGEALYRHRAS